MVLPGFAWFCFGKACKGNGINLTSWFVADFCQEFYTINQAAISWCVLWRCWWGAVALQQKMFLSASTSIDDFVSLDPQDNDILHVQKELFPPLNLNEAFPCFEHQILINIVLKFSSVEWTKPVFLGRIGEYDFVKIVKAATADADSPESPNITGRVRQKCQSWKHR